METPPAPSAALASPQPLCAVCGRNSFHHYYRLASSDGWSLKCFRCALRHRSLVANGLKTAAVVGTVLTAINQGDVLVHGSITAMVLAKMALTYAVPYLVSSSGALAASRARVGS